MSCLSFATATLSIYMLPGFAADEHYHTLREIVFCYENAKLPLVGYRTNCLQEKLKALVEADRAALISYLRGETATCPQIDQQAVEAYVPPAPTSTRPKRKAEEISTVAPAEGTVTSADADRLSKLRSKFFPLYASKSSIYNIAGKVHGPVAFAVLDSRAHLFTYVYRMTSAAC